MSGVRPRFTIGEEAELHGERVRVVAVERSLLRARLTVEYLTGDRRGERITVDQAFLNASDLPAAMSGPGSAA